MREKNCVCYKDDNKEGARIRTFIAGYNEEITITEHEIVFVIKGVFRIGSATDTTLVKTMTSGEFIYLPTGMKISCHAVERSQLLCVKLVEHVRECDLFRINKPQNMTAEDVNVIYTLKANNIIKSFTKNLIEVINSGMKCMNYMSPKGTELILLLHHCYTQEECTKFFLPFISVDMAFSEFIRLNHHKYKTVRDVAAALSMSPHNFTAKFKRVFGEKPITWKRKQQTRLIYSDVCQSHETLQKIADRYQFSSPANFTRYCVKNYGLSPSRIRKKLDGK